MTQDKTRILATETLADSWGVLTKYRISQRRRDGTWQDQTREAYDRGHGAVALLHDPETDTVLLTEQFRLPVYLNDGPPGRLIEAPAGLLDGAAPAVRMAAELEEETGFAARDLRQIGDLYTSPGSVTERLVFFLGSYDSTRPIASGGGNAEEGEDITALHIALSDALAMSADGRIRDAKTILLLQRLALERSAERPLP